MGPGQLLMILLVTDMAVLSVQYQTNWWCWVVAGGYDDDSIDTKQMDKKHSVCLVTTRWTNGAWMEPAMMMVGIWYLATVS